MKHKVVPESQIFYKHLAELTPEAVVIYSEGNILYANPAALKLIGAKSAKEVIGQSIMKFIHPDSVPLIQSRIKKLLQKKTIAPLVEAKFVNLKGEIIVAETKAVPFFFQGKTAILAILRNITEKKTLETELRKSVALRDEFISVASHELKTPVTSLKLYLQVMQKQLEKDGETQFSKPLEKIHEQIDRLTKLINDLLSISKIQHGKLEFSFEEIVLDELIKDTVDALQTTDTKHEIILKGQVKRTILADRYRLYQVMTNLLTNAIKYSPQSEIIIVNLAETKKYALISVQDFGIGIAKVQQKKIFDQFYQAYRPDEKTYPGLGMGLYIANEIIKRHGGTMRVESEKSKGSTFTFTLPFS